MIKKGSKINMDDKIKENILEKLKAALISENSKI